MVTVDLNCDMGEGMNNDALIMPFVSSANIACGAHAGDEETMQQTIALAIEHGVAIGAHPGFADKANFGRLELNLSPGEVYQLVFNQVEKLRDKCVANKVSLHHVKPHGALYNMSARNGAMAAAIARAISDIDSRLILYGLSGSQLIVQGKIYGLRTASEVFADRTYQPDGSLTPRSQPNALIEDAEQLMQQVLQMVKHQSVTSTQQTTLSIKAQTICLHGDGEHAVAFAKHIHHQLPQHQVHVQTI